MHRNKNVRIQWLVVIPTIASAVFVTELFVKVTILLSNVKDLSLYFIVPTCYDKIKNGDEGGIDCGGSCLPSKICAIGSSCNSGSDCVSSACRSNICQGKYIHLTGEIFLRVCRST